MQTQKTSPWLIAFRVIFTVALLWCIAYIFRNSLQTGAESSLRSQAVMRAVNDLLAHLRRKMAHACSSCSPPYFSRPCSTVLGRMRHSSHSLSEYHGVRTVFLNPSQSLEI